jgi:ferredoxin
MGALQDLVHIKPITVPTWISKPLSALPYIYLVLALLLAATGADFIVCRYDPFIGFFRMNATFGMFVFGAIILILGIFVGRPYCRFLCPYGVLLSWMSRLSFWHTTVTPSTCIQCKLCETSCPVDAIDKPTIVKPEPADKGRKRLITLLILLPVFIFVGGFMSSLMYKQLSTIHPTVSLAEEIKWEIDNHKKTGSEESKAFHTSGIPAEQLFSDAASIQSQFYVGTWLGGALLGLFFGISLLQHAVVQRRTDYEPNKSNCVSCGKCYKYCPVDKNGKSSLIQL